MAEYLAIKNWAKYQSGKKGWDWIKDYVNQNDEKELARLSLFERGLLQELRRLRGRSGKNLPNDATHIAGAINAKGTDRARIGNALATLIEQKILILTNQEHDFVEERRGEEIRGEEIKSKPPARKARAKQPAKVQAASPETSSVQVVMYLPLNSGDEFGISPEDMALWKGLYPAVNVMQELRAMVGWCHANPTRRKTKTGVKAFINRWLAKAQNDPKAAQNFRSNGNGNGNYQTAAAGRASRNLEILLPQRMGDGVQGVHVPDVGTVQPRAKCASAGANGGVANGQDVARQPPIIDA